MLRLSKPLPVPTWPPAAFVVPSMYPWKTFCTSTSAGATPTVSRDSMMGMFEKIGSDSIDRRSKFWPEETVLVSSSGDTADTVTSSVSVPTSMVIDRVTCWPTASTRLLCFAGLNPCTLTVTS